MFTRIRKAKKASPRHLILPREIHLLVTGGCALILILALWLAYWLGIPAWYVRIGGIETSGIAKAVASCGGDDYAQQGDNAETFIYTFRFSDPQGQPYTVTREGNCNNLYSDGEHISLWYLPQDSQRILTAQEAPWLYIFTCIWLGVTGLMLRFFWLLLRPLLARS